MLIQFSGTQWSLITNSFELCAITLLAAAIFGLTTQSRVLFKYRSLIVLASVMCLIDFISYAQLLFSFISSSVGNDVLFGAGHSSFDYSSRYIAWIICLPIQATLLIKLVATDQRAAILLQKKTLPGLIFMLLLGYIGETNSQFLLPFGLLSMIVFIYVIWSIYPPFKPLLEKLSSEVKLRYRRIRALMVLLWCIYPVLYFLNSSSGFNLDSSNFLVFQQLLLVAADLLSKAYFSLEIFRIARMKSTEEGLPSYE